MLLSDSTILGERLISRTSVNLNIATKQTLYTVPAGKSLIVTRIVFRNSSIDTSASNRVPSIGYDAGASDVFDAAAITQTMTNYLLSDSTKYVSSSGHFDVAAGAPVLFLLTPAKIGAATNVLGFKLSLAISAGTMTVDIFGYLF